MTSFYFVLALFAFNLVEGVDKPHPRPPLALREGADIQADAAVSLMRSEPLTAVEAQPHEAAHTRHRSSPAAAAPKKGHPDSEMTVVQMLDSGAMHVLDKRGSKHRQSSSPQFQPAHRRQDQPAASLASKGTFNPLAGTVELVASEQKVHAQHHAASKKKSNRDDDSRSGSQDPFDGDGDADTDQESYGDDESDYDVANMANVKVAAEEEKSSAPNDSPLKASEVSVPMRPPPETNVEKLGEGIGAMAYERSPTGSRSINHDLRQRLQLQDFATVSLLLMIFGLTILLSCCSVYQVADDPSPACYYSEPKHYQQRTICETNDVDAFLAAFNTQPQNVRLRITGKNPEPGGFRRFLRNLDAHTGRPRGLAQLLPMRQRRRQAVLFDVALDLTPFITGDGRLSDENLMILQKYLNTTNHLETVLLQKKVDWPLWEDVATNIRQRLRTLGFPGDVEVRFEAMDEVLIYQNQKWSNFVRNRVTQALVVISVIGSAFWVPYVWARSKTTKVETRFRISVDPSRYWELVQEGLNAAEGFQSM